MHPLLRSASRLVAYLSAWTLILCLIALTLRLSSTPSWTDALTVSAVFAVPYAIFCLTPWYLCRMLPLKDERMWRALLNHVAAAFISGVAWVRLSSLALPRRFEHSLLPLFGAGLLVYLLSVALHYMYIALESSKEAVRREQEARVLAREAELKALKAQINPHFLFNCLHSISALTSIDPGQAREMCIRLSDFLRNTLRLGEQESISFAEELGLVNTYLAVEQVRFGSRLKVERDLDLACEKCAVPPLILQPLIENSVKHGIAGLIDGGTIRLTAHCAAGQLHVMVENDFDPDSPAPRKTGLGLTNVRNRIAARHGEYGRCDVQVTESRHRVELLLPCQGLNS